VIKLDIVNKSFSHSVWNYASQWVFEREESYSAPLHSPCSYILTLDVTSAAFPTTPPPNPPLDIHHHTSMPLIIPLTMLASTDSTEPLTPTPSHYSALPSAQNPSPNLPNAASTSNAASPMHTPEIIAFATRMYDAARQGRLDVFQQALPAGLPANMTNDKGDSLVCLPLPSLPPKLHRLNYPNPPSSTLPRKLQNLPTNPLPSPPAHALRLPRPHPPRPPPPPA